jgi:hypothetical protein
MNVQLKTVVSWVTVAVVGLLVAASAEAGSIQLWDGTSTLVITDQDFVPEDGSPADLSQAEGVVNFMGQLGIWTFTFTSGISTPALGSASKPVMELQDFSLSSSLGVGSLTIWFSEVGFTGSGPTVTSSVQGFTSGTTKFETFSGTGLFDESAPPLASATYGPGSFSSTSYTPFAGSSEPYSLTQKVTITHNAGLAVTSNFTTKVAVPDGGMTLSLLGLGLVGVAGLRRLFSKPGTLD